MIRRSCRFFLRMHRVVLGMLAGRIFRPSVALQWTFFWVGGWVRPCSLVRCLTQISETCGGLYSSVACLNPCTTINLLGLEPLISFESCEHQPCPSLQHPSNPHRQPPTGAHQTQKVNPPHHHFHYQKMNGPKNGRCHDT